MSQQTNPKQTLTELELNHAINNASAAIAKTRSDLVASSLNDCIEKFKNQLRAEPETLDLSELNNLGLYMEKLPDEVAAEHVMTNIKIFWCKRNTLRRQFQRSHPTADRYVNMIFNLRYSVELYRYRHLSTFVESTLFDILLREFASTGASEVLFLRKIFFLLNHYNTRFITHAHPTVVMQYLYMFACEHLADANSNTVEVVLGNLLDSIGIHCSMSLPGMSVCTKLLTMCSYEDLKKFVEEKPKAQSADKLLDESPSTNVPGYDDFAQETPFLIGEPTRTRVLPNLWGDFFGWAKTSKDMLNSANDMIQIMKKEGFAPLACETVKIFNQAGKDTAAALETITSLVTAAVEAIKSTLKFDAWYMLGEMIELAFMLYCDFCCSDNVPLMRWVLYFFKIIKMFKLTTTIVDSWKWCVKQVFDNLHIFSGKGQFAQAGHAPHEIIVALVGMILTKAIPSKDSIKSVTDLARFYNVIFPAISDGFSFLKEMLAFMPECVNLWTRTLCPKLFWSDALKEGIVSTWAAEVELFLVEDPLLIQYDQAKISTLKSLTEKGRLFEKQIGLSPDIPMTFSNLIRKQMQGLEPFLSLVNEMSKWGETRKTPFCICLWGDSQIGKSSISAMIACYLFPGLTEGKARFVRKVSDEFWSRYTGQPVVVYDDAFQNVELLDGKELIDLISNAPYPMNMSCIDNPALGNKGDENKAEVVILNTNFPFPCVDGVLRSKDALYKRRHLMIEVLPKNSHNWTNPETGKYEVKKDWDYEYMWFRITDSYIPDRVTKEFQKLDDLLHYVGEQFDKWTEKEMKVLESIRTNAKRAADLGRRRIDKISKFCSATVESPIKTPIEEPAVAQGLITALNTASGAVCAAVGFADMAYALSQWAKIDKDAAEGTDDWKWKDLLNARMATAFAASLLGVVTFITNYRDTRLKVNFPIGEPDLMFIPGLSYEYRGGKASTGGSMAKFEKHEAEARYGERTAKQKRAPIRAQATSDVTASQLIDRLMDRVGEIQVCSTAVRTMGCLPIGGRLVLAPAHLFMGPDGKLVPEESKMTVTIEGSPSFITYFQKKNYHRLTYADGSHKDAVVYNFGRSMRSFRKLISQFVSENDLKNIKSNIPAQLVKHTRVNEMVETSKITERVSYLMQEGNAEFILMRGWKYRANTQPGDCGSPLIMFDSSLPRKILGIHVCARSGSHVGYSDLVTMEMLEKFEEIIDKDIQNFPFPTDVAYTEGDISIPEHLSWVGTVDKSRSQSLSLKTDIIRSPICGRLSDPITAPSVISPFDKRIVGDCNPWQNGIDKLKPGLPFPPTEMTMILDDLKETLRSWNHTPIGLLSEHQAINGDATVSKYCYPMNLHSSAGFPYTRLDKQGDKRGGKFFLLSGEPGNYRVSHKLLREKLDTRENFAKSGERIDSLVMACLKDERVKLEKIPIAKTRLFCLFPCDHTILMRRYFLEFICATYEHHGDSFSAIGINPHSTDWDTLGHRLKGFSDLVFGGDYANYDGSLNAELMSSVLEVIEYFYRDEENHEERTLIRAVLFDEIVHTVMQAGDTIFAKHGSDPSGTAMTTVLNTWVNYIIMSFAYLKLAPPAFRSMKSFHENVLTVMYGDDNLSAVKPRAISFFNLVNVAEYLSLYGITLKDSKKTGILEPYTTLEKSEFLKNGFRRQGMNWMATLSRDSINEMINWIRTSLDDKAALLDNANTALRFMYFYGPSEFSSFRAKLDRVLFDVYQGDYKLYTYQYLDGVFMDTGHFEELDSLAQDTAYAQGKDEPTISDMTGFSEKVGTTTAMNDIIFSEQSGVVQNENASIPPPSALLGSIMAEETWTIAKIFAKPLRITTLDWTTSDAVNTNLLQLYPFLFMLQSTTVWSGILRFMFFKATTVFRIEVNGHRFASGLINAFGVPCVSFDVVNQWHGRSRAAQTSVRHQLIDACENTVAELRLPFIYDKTHYQTRFEAGEPNNTTVSPLVTLEPWVFNLRVFNVLRTASGSSNNLKVSIFMYFEDVEVKVPLPAAHYSPIGPPPFAQASVEIKMKGWDSLLSSFLPQNIISDVFGKHKDKPTDPTNPTPMVRRPMGYLSNSRNVEHITKLCHEPSLADEPMPVYGTVEDEMSFDVLKKKSTHLMSTTVTLDSAQGAVLWEMPISPIPNNAPDSSTNRPNVGCGINLNSEVGTDDTIPVPLLTYLSMPFSYFTGGLNIDIKIACTAFHTAKFAFVIHYGTACSISQLAAKTAGSFFFDPTSTYTTFFELNGDKKCFSFHVPYIANTPYRRIPKCMYTNRFDNQVMAFMTMDNFESNIGYMGVMLINNLVAPGNVSPTIDMNIFISGADDFCVASMNNNNINWCAPRGNAVGDPISAQGSACNVDGPEYNKIQIPKGLDVVRDLRDVIKRYTYFNWQPKSNVTYTGASLYVGDRFFPYLAYTLPLNHIVNGLDAVSHTNNSPFAFLSSMYRGYRGALRMKICSIAQNRQILEPFAPPYTGGAIPTVVSTPNINVSDFRVSYLPEIQVSGGINFEAAYDLAQRTTGEAVQPVDASNVVTGTQFRPTAQESTLDQVAIPAGSIYTAVASRIPITWRGNLDMMMQVQPNVEFEMPWMQPRLFTSTCLHTVYEKLNLIDIGSVEGCYHTLSANAGTLLIVAPDSVYQIQLLVAAGDDFSFGAFMGVPMIEAANPRLKNADSAYSTADYFPNMWGINTIA